MAVATMKELMEKQKKERKAMQAKVDHAIAAAARAAYKGMDDEAIIKLLQEQGKAQKAE